MALESSLAFKTLHFRWEVRTFSPKLASRSDGSDVSFTNRIRGHGHGHSCGCGRPKHGLITDQGTNISTDLGTDLGTDLSTDQGTDQGTDLGTDFAVFEIFIFFKPQKPEGIHLQK